MPTMQVMRFNDSTDAPALLAGVAPIPQPGPGQLLVRVHAAGVTPTEMLWYPTLHSPDGGIRQGAIPGHEFSGVVAAIGADVDPAQIGQEVFGMNDWFADGATAEYCLALPAKPARLSRAELHQFSLDEKLRIIESLRSDLVDDGETFESLEQRDDELRKEEADFSADRLEVLDWTEGKK